MSLEEERKEQRWVAVDDSGKIVVFMQYLLHHYSMWLIMFPMSVGGLTLDLID